MILFLCLADGASAVLSLLCVSIRDKVHVYTHTHTQTAHACMKNCSGDIAG